MVQKAYKENPDVGLEGNSVYAGGAKNVRVLIASEDIPFGRVVSYDPDNAGRIVLGGDSEHVGVSQRQVIVGGGSTESMWAEGTPVPASTEDYVWMRLATGSANATHGGSVHVVESTGEIRADEDAGNTTVLADASFDSAGTAGELVKVKIDIT